MALLAGDCRSQALQRKAATMGVDHLGGAWMALWDLLEFFAIIKLKFYILLTICTRANLSKGA